MDLKKKFNQQLKKLNFKSFGGSESFGHETDEGLSPEDETEIISDVTTAHFPQMKAVEQRKLPLSNPHREKDVLDSIETVYYNDDETFDPSNWELQKLGSVLNVKEIQSDRKVLREQLSVVSKKMSDLILENHPSYAAELKKVAALQKSLLVAYDICCTARGNLKMSREIATSMGIKILANYRKRILLRRVMEDLRTIKTLQETDIRLRELLEEGNYSGAIQLCLECQKAAETYRHFKCIGELNCKLQDTLVLMEEQLDRALSSVAVTFDVDRYSRLQSAYSMLGKSQVAVDQLLMHVASGIHNSALSVVTEYTDVPDESIRQSLPYSDLCKKIPADRFSECLVELCRILWRILHSYHCILRFHLDQKTKPDGNDDSSETGIEKYIEQKLMGGLTRVWGDAVQKINSLIQSSDLTGFKFDNFLEVIELGNRFIKIGDKYFNTPTSSLNDTIQEQTSAYFKCYHRARMEELRAFLESEAWELCPVPRTFTLFDLQEYSFMKTDEPTVFFDAEVPEISGEGENTRLEGDREDSTILLFMDSTEKNPFDPLISQDTLEDYLEREEVVDSEDSDEVSDELKKDFIDEGIPKAMSRKKSVIYKSIEKLPPILCNTSLNVLRLFGRYLHMVSLLKTIAFDVITCLAQLFDYYFYVVSNFFGTDSHDVGVWLFSQRLAGALKKIENTLVAPTLTPEGGRVPMCVLAPVPGFTSPEHLFGLSSRAIGVESVVYVAQQLVGLQKRLENVIPTEKRVFLHQFFAQTIGVVDDLRRVVYGSVATRSLNYFRILNAVCAVNWEISELMSQHNGYVDFLVKELQEFRQRLDGVAKAVPIAKESYATLWEVVIQATNKVLVEGYAAAKKCTNEGRALMQLDFQQLVRKLETVTEMRPIPDKEYVENYIKAYYVPESAIEEWIVEHKEYPPRHIISLLNVSTHISRKTRHRLTTALEEKIATNLS